MKTDLSDLQLETYHRDGVLVVEDFLSPAEVGELSDAVEEAVARMGRKKVTEREDAPEEGEGYYDNVFLQRLNLWRINETVKDYFLSSELGAMMCKLEGIEGLRVWHDQTLQKKAWGNPTSWHLDNPYWSFYSRNSISIWIALDDATYQNGCMYYLPGTHKTARFDNASIGQNMNALFEVYPEWKEMKPLAAPMKKGSAGFHNGLVAHGAGANMTPSSRRAMTCAYMPEGSTFNGQRNILPKDYFESLKVGDVLENEDWNPLVYSAKRVMAEA